MVLRTMIHPYRGDDEVSVLALARVLAVILARAGCGAGWRPARGRLLKSHWRGNSKWRIRTSSGRMLAWWLYLQWRLPLDSPKVPMTPRLITALSVKASMRQKGQL